ncbi:hypothetical protein [Vreelandella rituensis]|uniref:hypothetical protein n=1 Tax=Vreelandella rituensis TaxID=2282306 RepID=UPI001C69A580|nr:hypothetical protein [Halomonas rituensis]
MKRDVANYSQCTFSSGKRYHADLNAAYNITAPGHVYFQDGQRKQIARVRSQTSTHAPRTPATLSMLWQQSA